MGTDLGAKINNIIQKSIPNKLSERDKNIIYMRNILGDTLEEVGRKFDITSERVRQREFDILNQYNENLVDNGFIEYLATNFKDKGYFYIKDLKEILNKDNHFITKLIVKGNIKSLHYFELLKRVYFQPVGQIINSMDDIIVELPNSISLRDMGAFFSLLSGLIEDISYEECVYILKTYNIHLYGSHFFRGKNNEKEMLEIIYREFHHQPLTINDQGADLLNKYFNDVFSFQVEYDKKIWDTRTNRIKDVILVNPKTYINIHHIYIKENIIKELKDIIESNLINKVSVYARDLFNEMNLKYPDNNIISGHHIYSLAKYYFSDLYQFSTGNSMRISQKDTTLITNIQRVYDICLSYNGIVDIKTICKITHWNEDTAEMAIGNNTKLIKLGTNRCAIFDSLFREVEKLRLKEIIDQDMSQGYSTTDRLYFKLLSDDGMSKAISRNNIKSKREIINIIKELDNTIGGHSVFLYYKNTKIRNVRDVIYSRFPQEVFRVDMVNVLKELHIRPNEITPTIENLLKNKKYFQVSSDKYVNYNSYPFETVVSERILNFFNEISQKYGYVIPNNYLDVIKCNYESTEYDWNQYTISEILTRNGYKKLHRYNASYEYEILVLVKDYVEYNDVSYLIFDLIKNQYKGQYNEKAVYEFLAAKGIYKAQVRTKDKRLNLDAKQNGLISVDTKGNVKL